MFPSWQTDVLEASGRFPESSRKLPEASGSFSGRRQLGASQRSLGGMRGIQDTPCGKSSGRGRGCQTIYCSEGCTTGFVLVFVYFYRLRADGPTRACLAISMKYVMDVQPALFVTENVRGSIADRVKELTRNLYEVDVVAGCPQDVGLGCNRRDREFVVGVHRGKGAPGTQGQAVLYMANIYIYICIYI